jgi:hypothetical protein
VGSILKIETSYPELRAFASLRLPVKIRSWLKRPNLVMWQGALENKKMKHPLLFNPFHSRQEQLPERAQEARRHAGLSVRTTPICGHCRSDDIVSNATVQWSNERQEWELADTFAKPAHCNSCNVACKIVWLPLN